MPNSETKTLVLELSAEMHERIEKIIEKRQHPVPKEALACEALSLGLNVLESALKDIEELGTTPVP